MKKKYIFRLYLWTSKGNTKPASGDGGEKQIAFGENNVLEIIKKKDCGGLHVHGEAGTLAVLEQNPIGK